MRFLVDAQLSPRLAVWLRERGHEADHVGPVATDVQIVLRAQASGAVIVSKDADFIGLLESLDQPPQLLWVRVGNAANRILFARLTAQWSKIESELGGGQAVVEVE